MKKTLILILALLSFNVAFSQQSFMVDNIVYEETPEDKTHLMVVEGWVVGDTIIIPENIYWGGNNYTVTKIGPDAFSYFNQIKVVVLPNTITKIGDRAFCYCKAVQFVKN